jgi:hypothetical protein
MNCPDCDRLLQAGVCACGYGRPTEAYVPLTHPSKIVRSTESPHPIGGISIDEFGPALFATIKICGGILGLREQIACAIHQGKGFKVQEFTIRLKALQEDLAKQLPSLPTVQAEEVRLRYPWITGI